VFLSFQNIFSSQLSLGGGSTKGGRLCTVAACSVPQHPPRTSESSACVFSKYYIIYSVVRCWQYCWRLGLQYPTRTTEPYVFVQNIISSILLLDGGSTPSGWVCSVSQHPPHTVEPSVCVSFQNNF
jgi:hypothetical protein